MIIYSVTVKIDLDIHDEWLKWMKEVHVPDVMNTGLFMANRMYRVLNDDESDGITYNFQYGAKSMGDYFTYQREHAAALQKDHTERYKDKFVAFRTILKEVE